MQIKKAANFAYIEKYGQDWLDQSAQDSNYFKI